MFHKSYIIRLIEWKFFYKSEYGLLCDRNSKKMKQKKNWTGLSRMFHENDQKFEFYGQN